jgi:crotonobetainyl-CoA:carnitine CoA-transferase CaiB-like acyl-CoA transferase
MLEGIRVIELGNFITGPLAAMMLGDLGAEVVKVERPEGDPFRRGHGGQYGPAFVAYNRNKKSIVLDTRLPADRATLLDLVATADVLIDNFRPAVLDKMGLDAATLARRNPRLVHCSITGFGTRGPYRDRPAFDTVGQALSGIASFLVDPQAPESFGPTIADNATGMYAAYGVLGALVERARTGRGRRIEVNMLEASMAFIQDGFTGFTMTGAVGGRQTRIVRSQCFAFRCADDRLIGIHLSTTEKFWQELARAVGAPEWIDDERFRTHQNRVGQYHVIERLLADRMVQRTRAEWMVLFDASDVPFAPIHTVQDALEDPQVEALGSVVEMHHPEFGTVRAIDCPVLVDGERPRRTNLPPPKIGEQTDELRAGLQMPPAG